jgi:G3E family GTPase
MSSEPKRIPIHLLTGFLGSGKTTLLNALLKAPAFANTAVIVNEFGEIGLDHFLIEQSQDNVVLLDAGCLCCTISESLHETLAELHAKRVRGEVPPFERVVVETTGLADPGPILNTLLGHRLVTAHYRLEAAIVTVDAQHVLALIAGQPEVARQIAIADRLVLTKTDMAGDTGSIRARLTALNAWAPVVVSVAGQAALEAFAPLDRYRLARAPIHEQHDKHDHEHQHHHPHDRNRHDARIRAVCLTFDSAASWSGIAAWWQLLSDMLGERLLRCKGLLRIADTGESVFIQGVQRVFHRPERLVTWPDADPRSRLVCIARDTTAHEIESTLVALQCPAGTDPRAAAAEIRAVITGNTDTTGQPSGTI